MDNLASSSPLFEKMKAEFINADQHSSPTLTISDRFIELKEIICGNAQAPFPWLQHFGDSAVRLLSSRSSSMLMKKSAYASHDEKREYIQKMPFAKSLDQLNDQSFMIQQNYYYGGDCETLDIPKLKDIIANDINFNRGYYETCTECAAMGIIWDSLRLQPNDGSSSSMQSELEKILTMDGKGDSKHTLQQGLALAIMKVHSAKKFNGDRMSLQESVDDLAALIRDDFQSVYQKITERFEHDLEEGAPVSNVWRWRNPEMAKKMVQITVHFLKTGAWILPKLLLQTPQIVSIAPERITELIFLINSYVLESQEAQWFNAITLFSTGCMQRENQVLLFDLPYILLFVTCTMANSIQRLLGRNTFRVLAGLVSTNHFYHCLFLAPFSRDNTFSSGLEYILKLKGSTASEPNRALDLVAHRHVRMVASHLCSSVTFSKEACEIITDFSFPFLCNQTLASNSYYVYPHSHSKTWTLALRELEMYTKLQHSAQLEEERALVSQRMDHRILSASRLDMHTIASAVVSETYGFVQDLFKEQTSAECKRGQIIPEHATTLFIGIQDLWKYVFLDIFSQTQTLQGRCIVLDFQNVSQAIREMQPCLLMSAKIAIQHAKLLENERMGFKNRDLIRMIWEKDGGTITLTQHFVLPDIKNWEMHTQDLLAHFVGSFKGFDALPRLSDYEIRILLKKYREFELPVVEDYVLQESNLLLKIVPLFLRLKNSRAPAMIIPSGIQCPENQTLVHTAYYIGFLNLLLGQMESAEILSMVEIHGVIKPSAFLAEQFVSNVSTAPILVETALHFIKRTAPMRIDQTHENLQLLLKEYSEQERDIPFKNFIEQLQFISTNEGKRLLRLRAHPGNQTKEAIVLHACCMRSYYPNMRILFNADQIARTLTRYYAINPDILTAAMIHSVSLTAALCLCGGENLSRDLNTMQKRMNALMTIAKETLKVTRDAMEKTLFFIADYFAVYAQSSTAEFHDESLKTWLETLWQGEKDELVKAAATGMMLKLREPWNTRLADKCLLDALKEMGGWFEGCFNRQE